ncbi:MAG: MraY family glycosyltransferase [Cellvibrionaceae bacterium]
MITTITLELLATIILIIPLSYFITLGYRRYALNKNVLDIPNQRSSHQTPTPRGGGVSIIISYCLIIIALNGLEILTNNQTLTLLIASLPIALIGLIDDHKPIPSSVRFGIHFGSAVTALWVLDNPVTLPLGNLEVALDGFWIVLLAIILTWLTNLYNFMDGIDGIASTEAIFVLLGVTAISLLSSPEYLPLLFIAPIIGFLILNWAPAKIFMGDAGSGFIGAFIGMLAIVLASEESTNLWVWITLLGTFIADTSWTLIYRAIDGQKWHQPHRSHSYQILSRRLESHTAVNFANILVIALWLTPLACAAQQWPKLGLPIAITAYLPLLWTAKKLKAGAQEASLS